MKTRREFLAAIGKSFPAAVGLAVVPWGRSLTEQAIREEEQQLQDRPEGVYVDRVLTDLSRGYLSPVTVSGDLLPPVPLSHDPEAYFFLAASGVLDE